ncbi:MAG: hypothetical protein INR62_02665 [Rhodospirillales bacterium]|nr:hypothetical protein [Acetobacter sp.]
MKTTLLLTFSACAAFALHATLHATPARAGCQAAHVRALCQNPTTRILMIHDLTNTIEGKQEVARTLAHDAEFRSYYETHALNPG